MKPSRMAFYIVIALVSVVIAGYVLIEEPPPGWPTNMVHLLTRH